MIFPDPVSLSDRFVAAVEKMYGNPSRIHDYILAPRDHHGNFSKTAMIDEITNKFLSIAPLKKNDSEIFKKTVSDSMLSQAPNLEFLHELDAPNSHKFKAFRESVRETAAKAAHKNLVLRHGVSLVANDNRSPKI